MFTLESPPGHLFSGLTFPAFRKPLKPNLSPRNLPRLYYTSTQACSHQAVHLPCVSLHALISFPRTSVSAITLKLLFSCFHARFLLHRFTQVSPYSSCCFSPFPAPLPTLTHVDALYASFFNLEKRQTNYRRRGISHSGPTARPGYMSFRYSTGSIINGRSCLVATCTDFRFLSFSIYFIPWYSSGYMFEINSWLN